jgi:hypothetical protein
MAICTKAVPGDGSFLACSCSANNILYARSDISHAFIRSGANPKLDQAAEIIDIDVPHLWFRCFFFHHCSLLVLTRQAEHKDEDEGLEFSSVCLGLGQCCSRDIEHYGVVD